MWLDKIAESEADRINNNILRLLELQKQVHHLGYFVVASQSGGYEQLKDILKESVVRGRKLLWAKLNEADIGENNQKLALDSPLRFQHIMREAESMIQLEINKEKKRLRDLKDA